MRSTKIYIIILNWNGKKDTIECLASLSNVAFSSYQPLVVDNGSTDGSVKEIRAAFPNVPIHQTGANLGFAAGNNQGIEWALSKNAEWILLLNNDTVVSPDFLTAFMEAAKQQPKAKILGAKIYRYTGRDSKIGIWQGGALNLNQALPAPKQLNLTSLAMQAGHKFSGCPTPPEPIFQSRAVYILIYTCEQSAGESFTGSPPSKTN
jgi:GT2 family glycosyltransferase